MALAGFFSDPHFGHSKIIQYCNRPFADIDEMAEVLIANYNARVGVDDYVYWLGDAFFKWGHGHPEAILNRMNGIKFLILGNHDRRQSMGSLKRIGFADVQSQAAIMIAGRIARLCHYPYAGTTSDDRYQELRPAVNPHQVLLHGHSHSNPFEKVRTSPGLQIDCGVDAWGYGIAAIDEIEAIVKVHFNEQ